MSSFQVTHDTTFILGRWARLGAPLPRLAALDVWGRRLGRRLAWRVISFSSVITLILTSLYLYQDFQVEIGDVRKQMAFVETTYVHSLSESLWAVDRSQIEAETAAIANLGAIVYVAVKDPDGTILSQYGHATTQQVLRQVIPLTRLAEGQAWALGTLEIQATLTQAQSRLLHRLIFTLAINALKTFFVAFALLWLMDRLVVRRISQLAAVADRIGGGDWDGSSRLPLSSGDLAPDAGDEITDLAANLERMRTKLRSAFAELKRHEAIQSKLLEEAQLASRSKDEFLMAISHELRTPLTPILGFCSLYSDGLVPIEQLPNMIKTITRNAENELHLVKQLISAALMASGKMTIDREPVDMAALTLRACTDHAQVAQEKQIALSYQLPEAASANVLGDAPRLREVVDIFLSNALKFTKPGGSVIVVLSLPTQTHPATLRLAVADTGIGISREYLPRVFAKFSQQDSGLNRRHGGLGVGLALAEHIVKLHGGTIAVESPGLDQGSCFVVELPLASQPTAG